MEPPRRCPTCPVRDGLECLGQTHIGACGFARESESYRASLVRRAETLAVWPRIAACPQRGYVLPVSRQVECGCRGQELTECRARNGPTSRPDAVTLDECVRCMLREGP